MLRPHELSKWLNKTNNTELLPINPESPLLLSKACKGMLVLKDSPLADGYGAEREVRARNLERANKYTERILRTFKQSAAWRRQGKIRSNNYFSEKVSERKALTVPSECEEKSAKKQNEEQKESTPVLMIKELKLQSIAYMAEREARQNQKLEQIEIRLNSLVKSRKQFHQIRLATRMDTTTASQQPADNLPAQTAKICVSRKRVKTDNQTQKTKQKASSNRQGQGIMKQTKSRMVLALSYRKPFNPPNGVTAKSYLVYRPGTQSYLPRMLISVNSKNSQEIASLTKIMTAILVIEVCKLASIDKYAEEVTISSFEAGISGTTASLQEGQVYTIEQLLYGLMLPSGNDASVALAAWAGLKLIQNSRSSQDQLSDCFRSAKFPRQKPNCESGGPSEESDHEKRSRGYRRFIEEMNSKARSLKMKKTVYMNSHGLSHPQSKSCAYDVALLCQYCMKNETFRSVVRCQKYSGFISTTKPDSLVQSTKIYSKSEGNWNKNHLSEKQRPVLQTSSRNRIRVQWHNTHQLIRKFPDDYLGIKTGFTYTAGPCLASCVRLQGQEYLIVVLGCESSSMRFRDTENLRRWAAKQLQRQRQQLCELQNGKRRSYMGHRKALGD